MSQSSRGEHHYVERREKPDSGEGVMLGFLVGVFVIATLFMLFNFSVMPGRFTNSASQPQQTAPAQVGQPAPPAPPTAR